MIASRTVSIIAEEMDKVFGTKSSWKWPPTKSTRDAIIERVVKHLSETFQIPTTEFDVIVPRIEEEAFNAAGSSSAPAAAIFEVYMEEFRKRIVEYSMKIWPPPQGVREAVVEDYINNLSETYQIPKTEGDVIVRRIEEEAFTAAGSSSAPAEGILDVYSQEMHDRFNEYTRKIWPPPRGMRNEVVAYIITAFSDVLPQADVIFREAEEEAFNAISASSGAAAGEDGVALNMAYHKEMTDRLCRKLFPK